jgi:hypothetical protein
MRDQAIANVADAGRVRELEITGERLEGFDDQELIEVVLRAIHVTVHDGRADRPQDAVVLDALQMGVCTLLNRLAPAELVAAWRVLRAAEGGTSETATRRRARLRLA